MSQLWWIVVITLKASILIKTKIQLVVVYRISILWFQNFIALMIMQTYIIHCRWYSCKKIFALDSWSWKFYTFLINLCFLSYTLRYDTISTELHLENLKFLKITLISSWIWLQKLKNNLTVVISINDKIHQFLIRSFCNNMITNLICLKQGWRK